MKKKYIPLFALTGAVLTTLGAVILMDVLMEQKELVHKVIECNRTIVLLQKRIKKPDPLQVTEDILHLLKKNRIAVETYQILEHDTGKELLVRGKGTGSAVIALLYSMTVPDSGFHITFAAVETDNQKGTLSLMLRILYG